MRGALLLLAAVIAAGCVDPAATDGERRWVHGDTIAPLVESERTWGGFEAQRPCATLSLVTDHAVLRANETLTATATLTSCDATARDLSMDGCGDRPVASVTLLRNNGSWRLDRSDVARAANASPQLCVINDRWGPADLLAPGDSRVETFTWNGTFATDPCDPADARRIPSCLQFARAEGEQVLVARALIEGHAFEAQARVVVEPTGARVEPVACGMSVRVEPAEILPGEESRIVARYDHCGAEDVAIGEWSACGHGNGFEVQVNIGTRPYRLGGSGALGDAPTMCLHIVPVPRLLFPGGFVEVPFGWNGTIVGETVCAASEPYECSTTFGDAPAGDYALHVIAQTRDGETLRATGSLRVLSRA